MSLSNHDFKLKRDASVLQHAIARNVKEVKKDLANGADKNMAVRGYAIAGLKKEVDDLLDQGADINEAIYGYAFMGNVDEAKNLMDKAVDKSAAKNAAVAGFAYCELIDIVNELLDEGANKSYAVRGYICADNVEQANLLLDKGADINEAAYLYAFEGKIDQVNTLLAKGADLNEAILGYARHYVKGGSRYKDEVDALIDKSLDKIASLNVAVKGYANYGCTDQVNDLLKRGASKDIALQGYIEGKNEDQAKILQYDIQKSQRNIRTVWVVLGAIFLTPLSLIVTIPLWIRAKNKEPIQKLSKSQNKYDEVKEKRKALRVALTGKHQKAKKDFEKPQKTLISKDKKIVYLVDKAQLARFNLFAKHSQKYLNKNKQAIQAKVQESKDESKEIIKNLGISRNC